MKRRAGFPVSTSFDELWDRDCDRDFDSFVESPFELSESHGPLCTVIVALDITRSEIRCLARLRSFA